MKNKAGILWMVATTVLFVIVTAVVRYLGSEMHLIQAALMGSFLFGEQPNFWIWLGGGIIVISATYNARKERTVRSLSD